MKKIFNSFQVISKLPESIIWKDNKETLYLKKRNIISDLELKYNPYFQEYMDLFNQELGFEEQEEKIDKLNTLVKNWLSFSFVDVRRAQIHMLPELYIVNQTVYIDPDEESWLYLNKKVEFYNCKIIFTKKSEYNIFCIEYTDIRFRKCEIYIEWNTLFKLDHHSRYFFNECYIYHSFDDFNWLDCWDNLSQSIYPILERNETIQSFNIVSRFFGEFWFYNRQFSLETNSFSPLDENNENN